MAIVARTWVDGELVDAAKMTTLQQDILELDAVAGFFNAQFGTITISDPAVTADATVSSMSARAIPGHLGHNGGSVGANVEGVRLSKVNSTTIRATRLNGSTGDSIIVNFVIQDPRG